MKSFISLVVVLLMAVPALSWSGVAPSSRYQCACFQNVPFEGYIIYVIEKFQGQESWLTLEASPTNYDSIQACNAEISVNKTCEELGKL